MHVRRFAAGSIAVAAALLGVTAESATAASDSDRAVDRTAPVSESVSGAEQERIARLDHRAILKSATPMEVPQNVPSKSDVSLQRGAEVKIAPSAPESGAADSSLRAAATSAGGLWPLGPTVNPNRQVGKLVFWTGTRWSWCTASAVNSENKSTVITAGHCVVNASTRQWYTNHVFYPGYQYGGLLGAWPVRYKVVTGNYYWTGASADDMAAVVVRPDALGTRIVNKLGGHGAWFNASVGNYRTSLGYPITDSRWPGYTADGQDARYCQGTDYYYSSGSFAGQLHLYCRMTGGASGGPWLTWVQSNWMGYVNSVNSNKGGIGAAWANRMFGPYFNNQELAVFNVARTA
jgi:hypothetical protein